MRKLYFFILLLISFTANSQVAVADVQSIYGGRVYAITGGNIGGIDSFRVFVSTESANSIFYADGKRPPLLSPTFNAFKVLPCANASANLGSGIRELAYHETSGKVFFITNNGLYSASITATSATLVAAGSISDVVIKDNAIFFISKNGSNTDAKAGTLDASGNYTNTSSTSIASSAYTALVVGKNDRLYAFKEGTDPEVYQFNGTFNTSITLSAGTKDALSSLSTSIYWKAFGVYADTALFVGGTDNNNKQIAKSSAFGSAYTTINTTIAGTYGNNIEFHEGLVSNYFVYFGSAYSNSKGLAGTWQNLGNSGFETHPNDGAVHRISSNVPGSTILITTDQGVGQSNNSGATIFEINDGIEAVQVNDFDMNMAKNFGWLASKSGVRYVKNYGTSSQSWSKALFPNGDGSPYYTVDMIDEVARTAYSGNVRVYRTNDTGKVWQQVFSPENAPYNFNSGGTQIRSIRSCPFDTAIVFAAVTIQGSDLGGVFYSMNSGKNWSQLRVVAASAGQDVDAEDIEFTKSGSTITAWIGVKKNDAGASPYTPGVYKSTYSGASWSTPTHEASTATLSVNDLTLSTTRDTLLACGGNTGTSGPLLYMLKVSTSTWQSVPRNGAIPVPPDYDAVAMGGDTVFVGSEQYIDYTKTSGSSMQVASIYYAYPNGTQIQNLYYDELLAGTGTGFSSFRIPSVLPVKITSFTAKTTSLGNELRWINENDKETALYDVEFSCDGRNFNTSSTISSTGNKSYSFIDNARCNEAIYYRLKVQSKTGVIEYSSTIRIGGSKAMVFEVFPNPVINGNLHVQLTENATINIVDVSGKEIKSWRNVAAGITGFDVRGMASGTYIIRVSTKHQVTSKVIILK